MAIKKLKGVSLAGARRQPGDIGGVKVHLSQEAKDFDANAGQKTGLTEWDGLGAYSLHWDKPNRTDLKRKKTTKLSKKRAKLLKEKYEGKTFTLNRKVDYGNAWWDDIDNDKYVDLGTGSKDAPQSPIWGYGYKQLTPAKVVISSDRDRGIYAPVSSKVVQPSYLTDGWKVSNSCLLLSRPFHTTRNTPCAPYDLDNTVYLPNGLVEQIKRSGLETEKVWDAENNKWIRLKDKLASAYQALRSKQPTKYEKKDAALNRSLGCVFRSRDQRPNELVKEPLTLDTCPVNGEESHWVPVTSDGMEKLIEVDEYHRRRQQAALQLESIRKAIGEDKYLLLVLSAQGKTNKEISEELRANGKDVSTAAVAKALQRIRKSLNTLKGGN